MIVRTPVDFSLATDAVGVGLFDAFGDPPPHAANTTMRPTMPAIAIRFISHSSLSDVCLEVAPQKLSRLRARPHVEPPVPGCECRGGDDMPLCAGEKPEGQPNRCSLRWRRKHEVAAQSS